MGTPKEWLELDGEPQLAPVGRIVAASFQPVIVAARPNQPLPPLPQPVEIVHDALDDTGPLAGIEAALASLGGRADAAFVTGCDHPFLTPAFLRRLVESLGDAAALVLKDEGRIRPLPGIYRVSTLLQLRELLADGERRAHFFADRCAAKRINVLDLRSVDPNLDSLQNINDADQYAAAKLRMVRPIEFELCDQGPPPER